ncbi:MAG: T9SS type A sorting domain-containing protein [Bacteroidota bacterium]
MRTGILFLFFGLLSLVLSAQFAPPAGEPGSTAIHQSDERLIAWAKRAEHIPSWQNIADTTLGKVPFGDVNLVIGEANGMVISLGDGGQVNLEFDPPIRDGAGFDFAVFENGFIETFLELAFVEVSSDGLRYVRFPATSNSPTDEQIGPFGEVDARRLNNLAGKYKVEYGTPFDLAELKDSMGIDLEQISHVRIIDVVGSIQAPYAQLDAQGQIVNDPWPTAFETSGFDLDAVGVINQVGTVANRELTTSTIHLYPNPTPQGEQLYIEDLPMQKGQWQVLNSQGQLLSSGTFQGDSPLVIQAPIPAGYYHLRLIGQDQIITKKWMIR